MHPEIVVSAIPMGLSMRAWEQDDHDAVGAQLLRGVEVVRDGGADFFVCPDNTAHLVLEKIADSLPLPGLHIADAVCGEILRNGWTSAGLLGTEWTMGGAVYEQRLSAHGIERLVPPQSTRTIIHNAIFEELCQGVFRQDTTGVFLDAIDELASRGAQCVILGCTEIPLIVTHENSSLPVLDSTRLLARDGVRVALQDEALDTSNNWIRTPISQGV